MTWLMEMLLKGWTRKKRVALWYSYLWLHFFYYLQLCADYWRALFHCRCGIVLAVELFSLVGLCHGNRMLYTLLSKPTFNKGGGDFLVLAKRDLCNSGLVAFSLYFFLWSQTLTWQSVKQCSMAQGTKRIDLANPIVPYSTCMSLCDLQDI